MSKALSHRVGSSVLGLLALAGCVRDSSLVALIENHPDEFPPPYVAIAPPSQASALGLQPVAVPDDAEPRRRAVVATARCFFVTTAPPKPGLDDYLIRYKLGKDLQAELRFVAVGVGLDLDAAKQVSVALHDLRVEEARLVPNPDGCDIEDSASFDVFTRQIVAGKVDLDFGVDMDLDIGVDVPIASTATVGVDGGWKVASSRALAGKDIVIAAMPERWTVRASRSSHDLGGTPQALDYPIPDTSAKLSVIRYDANGPALTLQLNTSLNQDAEALPDGWGHMGETFTLDLEHRQRNFLPEPGNRSITVRWSRGPAADDPERIVVTLELESLVAKPGK